MAQLEMPHPHLIVLRSAATIVLSAIIGQAGWASAFLGGESQYVRYHQIGAWLAMALTIATAVLYVAMRRSAGTVNVALAVLLAAVVCVQFTLGRLEVTSAHIFLGVLTVMLATSMTSWTYRHVMPTHAGG